MKKIILLILLAAAISAGFLWLGRQKQEQAPDSVSTRGVEMGEEVVENEGGPLAEEELSLPAFTKREFNGRDFNVGQVLAENEAYTRHYITYKSSDLTISGIMNVPKGKGPFPILFLNHGHIDTSIYTNGRGLKREQDYLARRGYVVVHSDYRNHADSTDVPNTDRTLRLGYAEDVINAIKAVQASDLPYIDKDRIGMLGHSMGGGVAWVIAVTQPGLVDAFVQFAPVSADARDNFEKWLSRRREVAEYLLATYGSPQENPKFWDGVSPMTMFEKITAPIIIHHGTADESVPLAWSQRSTKQLKELSKDVTLHEYPGEPHEFIDAWPIVMERTKNFFDRNLSL